MTQQLKELIAQTALLELLPDAFIGIVENGEIVLANGQTEALFGYSREELIGSQVELLLPARFAHGHSAHRGEYFADPCTRTMGADLELVGQRRDSSEFPAEISLSSIILDDGQVLATAAIRDVTDRVTIIREKERLQVEAENERLLNQLHHTRRLESLGELAGGIAHDFNNVLAVIINYAGFVAQDLAAEDPAANAEKRVVMRADVEQISVAAERAAHLTRQLLAFARREVVQPEVIDVNEVVTAVERLLRRTLGEHIELCSELAEGLHSVLIDPGQLEQILVNLAVNARDAMPDGGVLKINTANVEVDEEYARGRGQLATGPHVRLRVSDNGTGMPREVVERAFDPFFTTKAPGQGTGLGLATVYGIVQQAGGRARIYSEPSIGTTFSALLPATHRAPVRAASEIDPMQLKGSETILLVEDEQALREVTRRILASAGYRVLTAATGEEALAATAAEQGRIDLLLTDVIMPQMHGPHLAEQVAAGWPSIRIMFMSGFAQPILDSGGHLEPGVTLIEKPFSSPMLLARVRRVLTQPRG